jgi:hypothetical protein
MSESCLCRRFRHAMSIERRSVGLVGQAPLFDQDYVPKGINQRSASVQAVFEAALALTMRVTLSK